MPLFLLIWYAIPKLSYKDHSGMASGGLKYIVPPMIGTELLGILVSTDISYFGCVVYYLMIAIFANYHNHCKCCKT